MAGSKQERPTKAVPKKGSATPRQFRLNEETLAELDYLQGRYGLTGRSDVIRFLARRASQEERKKE